VQDSVHVEPPTVAPMHRAVLQAQPTAVAKTVRVAGKILAPTAVGEVIVVVTIGAHYGMMTLAVAPYKT